MLEVLITPRNLGVSGRRGDIISAGLAGTPWSPHERDLFWVAEWDDAELEARLMGRRAAGEAWPVEGLPYRGTEPATDVLMLPAVTITPSEDESTSTWARVPMTAADAAARIDAVNQAAYSRKVASLPQGSTISIPVPAPAEPPDLTVPMAGPPRRSRVTVDVESLTDNLDELGVPYPKEGVLVTLVQLDGLVSFDGTPASLDVVRGGMAALQAAAAQAPAGPKVSDPAGGEV